MCLTFGGRKEPLVREDQSGEKQSESKYAARLGASPAAYLFSSAQVQDRAAMAASTLVWISAGSGA